MAALLLLTPWLVAGQQLYQRVSTISHTSLKNETALIKTLASSHPLHCASLCVNSANMDGSSSGCNAFSFDDTGCTLANLHMLEERTDSDEDWPQVDHWCGHLLVDMLLLFLVMMLVLVVAVVVLVVLVVIVVVVVVLVVLVVEVVLVVIMMTMELPQLTMAATSLVNSSNLTCHGGDGCCREAR